MVHMSSDDYKELVRRRLRDGAQRVGATKRAHPHRDAIGQAVTDFALIPDAALYITSQGHRLRGSAGIPDCCGFYRGRFFWWECKIGADRLTTEQAMFVRRARDAGVLVVVGTLADLLDTLGVGDT